MKPGFSDVIVLTIAFACQGSLRNKGRGCGRSAGVGASETHDAQGKWAAESSGVSRRESGAGAPGHRVLVRAQGGGKGDLAFITDNTGSPTSGLYPLIASS